MSGLAVKQVFLKNFCKSISILEILTSSYHNLMGAMSNLTAEQKLNQSSMESFLETYYNCGNSHEIPVMFPENLPCETNISNTCVETSMCLKDKYLTDKQKYKAMRQWKRFKKGKNSIVSVKKKTWYSFYNFSREADL